MVIVHCGTHELTMPGTACIRPAQDQSGRNLSMDGKGLQEVPSTSEELLVVDSYWETESWCPSGMHNHAQRVTPTHVQVALTGLSGFRKQVNTTHDIGREREGDREEGKEETAGRFDQNTLRACMKFPNKTFKQA